MSPTAGDVDMDSGALSMSCTETASVRLGGGLMADCLVRSLVECAWMGAV